MNTLVKYTLLLTFLLGFIFGTFKVYSQSENDIIYTRTEEMPKSSIGSGNLLMLINETLVYPEIAKQNNIEGNVIIAFVIDKKGKAHDPIIARSVEPSLDSEALRIFRLMPDWIPGKHEGKKVCVKYTLAINFNIKGYEVSQKLKSIPKSSPPEPGYNIKDYFSINLDYPKMAEKEHQGGIVSVKFLVNEDGSITDANVIVPVAPLLDAEALRAVRRMPKWKPAILNGEPVKAYYTLPVNFIMGPQGF